MSRYATIRNTLFALVAVTGFISLGLAVEMAYEATAKRGVALRAVEDNATSDLLLVAAANWARERGSTAVALNGAEPAPAAALEAIAAMRKLADEAFRGAMQRLAAAHVDFKGKAALLAAADSAHRKLADLRAAIDADLKRPLAERQTRTGQWIPPATAMIEASKALRQAAESHIEDVESQLVAFAQFKHNVWVMSEFAGRERALVGGHVAEGRRITADTMQTLGELRGRVEQAFEAVLALADTGIASAELADEIQAVRRAFFEEFGAVRKSVIGAGAAGSPYPVTAPQWIAASTKGIDEIIKLSDMASAGARELGHRAAAKGTAWFTIALAAVALVIVVTALSFFVTIARVTAPIGRLTAAMARLADRDWSTEVPSLGRSDEIGRMAKAVQVFKDGGIENERLQQEAEAARERELKQKEEQRRLEEEAARAEERRRREAEEAKHRAEEERRAGQERARLEAERQRKAEMHALADGFEASVKAVVETVSSSASEMQGSATAMSATAEETSRQATAVA
ncbi:MAG: HAMP domain-containing protein, partial [Alphaproteobacteria bacterium]|nr:HAMP domain-containing protein [Alphaproteobacteria bacterium]